MNPRYMPTTPTGRRARLAEEIGEVMIEAGYVLQLLGKAGRFGINSRHPAGGLTNAEDLIRQFSALRTEIKDLEGAITDVSLDLVMEDANDSA